MIEALIAGFIIGTVVILFAVMCCMEASGWADKDCTDMNDEEDEEKTVIDIMEDDDENK